MPKYAIAQSSFCQSKTVTVINGNRPGGTGDMRMRLLIPYLKKYLPFNPSIVAQYMPDGGGRELANHIYRGARPDGLTIGNSPGGFVLNAILGGVGVDITSTDLPFSAPAIVEPAMSLSPKKRLDLTR